MFLQYVKHNFNALMANVEKEERNLKILKLYAKKYSIRTIAAELNITKSVVEYQLKKNKKKNVKAKKKGRRSSLPPNLDQKIIAIKNKDPTMSTDALFKNFLNLWHHGLCSDR